MVVAIAPDIALLLPPRFQHPHILSSSSTSRSPRCLDSSSSSDIPRPHRRRELLFQTIATSCASQLLLCPAQAQAQEDTPQPPPDLTITDKVYLEIAKCPTTTFTTASSSDGMLYCRDGEVMGRVVIGLYGRQVEETVKNFKAMCNGKAGKSYKGSLIHRVMAGQYIMAGRQGSSKERGEIVPPLTLPPNLDSVHSRSFQISHSRPGTVSLCLSENDDDDRFKLSPDYRNVEFLITTGPGPAPQLDNRNIVFGTVLEGLDVVRASATVPTYKPSEQIQQFNELAAFFGDERASNARNFWYRPLTALYISDCGEI